jgi:hypothetical protein
MPYHIVIKGAATISGAAARTETIGPEHETQLRIEPERDPDS